MASKMYETDWLATVDRVPDLSTIGLPLSIKRDTRPMFPQVALTLHDCKTGAMVQEIPRQNPRNSLFMEYAELKSSFRHIDCDSNEVLVYPVLTSVVRQGDGHYLVITHKPDLMSFETGNYATPHFGQTKAATK